LNCALKHIGQAEALMAEAILGYPEHKYLAIGHLAEAEAELLKDHGSLACMIRECRLNYDYSATPFPTMDIIRLIIERMEHDPQN
jgi:hypothetical protein